MGAGRDVGFMAVERFHALIRQLPTASFVSKVSITWAIAVGPGLLMDIDWLRNICFFYDAEIIMHVTFGLPASVRQPGQLKQRGRRRLNGCCSGTAECSKI